MTSSMWQHPYFNVFKNFPFDSWKKNLKSGDLMSTMDKELKCTVYRLTGSIPSSNFVVLPESSTQSLNLTGRFVYLLFKPIATKCFVVHFDTITSDGLTVRISISNLYKEFKISPTNIQFPLYWKVNKLKVHSSNIILSKDLVGPAPITASWSVLCLDLADILSIYLNKRYNCLKAFQVCANIYIKNIFTSDQEYVPGLSLEELKKKGHTSRGMLPLPREMMFFVSKGETYENCYDFVVFPNRITCQKNVSDDVNGRGDSLESKISATSNGAPMKAKSSDKWDDQLSQVVKDRLNLVHDLTDRSRSIVSRSELDENKSELAEECTLPSKSRELYQMPDIEPAPSTDRSVHVLGRPQKVINEIEPGFEGPPSPSPEELLPPESIKTMTDSKSGTKPNKSGLEPDPVMQLDRVVGCSTPLNNLLWSANGAEIIYPVYSIVVAMAVDSGEQRLFIGHTEAITCLSTDFNCRWLASGQGGNSALVRVWKYSTAVCLVVVKSHAHSLSLLQFSNNGNVLIGVGRDQQNKNLVVIWDTHAVESSKSAPPLARAQLDADIRRLSIHDADDRRFVTCGRSNVRFWRLRDNQLRNTPVNLGEFIKAAGVGEHLEFTDCRIVRPTNHPSQSDGCFLEPDDRVVYTCAKSGHVFEIDMKRFVVHHVRRLLPTDSALNKGKIKRGGIPLTRILVNESFVVTTSEDGYLRLWPLDFSHVYLEAEYDSCLTTAHVSRDCMKILVATDTGNVGYLDIPQRSHTIVMRSHTGRVLAADIDPRRRQVATVSEDSSIRIWHIDSLQQLSDLYNPSEIPLAIKYRPNAPIGVQSLSVGFSNGIIRVFDIDNVQLVGELKNHVGYITGLAYSPCGSNLYSCDSNGQLNLFNVKALPFRLIRSIGNVVAPIPSPKLSVEEVCGRQRLSVDPQGFTIAYIGPSEFVVTVADARSLSECLRVDITMVEREISFSRLHPTLEAAHHVVFSSSAFNSLIVCTETNRLLRLDKKDGRLINSQSDSGTQIPSRSLRCSPDSRFIVTAGGGQRRGILRIWDGQLRCHLGYQQFIGHSSSVNDVVFSPDQNVVVSVGEAIFMWKFFARKNNTASTHTGNDTNSTNDEIYQRNLVHPRCTEDRSMQPGISEASLDKIASVNTSALVHKITEANLLANRNGSAVDYSANNHHLSEPGLFERDSVEVVLSNGIPISQSNHQRNTGPPTSSTLSSQTTKEMTSRSNDLDESPRQHLGAVIAPLSYKHLHLRSKASVVAEKRYLAPRELAGLHLSDVLGCNSSPRATNNIIWNPDTGLFIYTQGCILIVEDLETGKQLLFSEGHTEDISCLAVSNDNRLLVSVSPGSCSSTASSDSGNNVDVSPRSSSIPCQMCVWEISSGNSISLLRSVTGGHGLASTAGTSPRVATLERDHHITSVVSMTFSPDDRFMVSLGDYRENLVCVWNAVRWELLVCSMVKQASHQVLWSPFSQSDFITVGSGDSRLVFWLLTEESRDRVSLRLHEARMPQELDSSSVELCCAVFTRSQDHSRPSTLEHRGSRQYITGSKRGTVLLLAGTSTGRITVWDTAETICLLHWEADTSELGFLHVEGNYLVSGGLSGKLKLWNIETLLQSTNLADENSRGGGSQLSGITLEREMQLDGGITTGHFDSFMEMGVAATLGGTIWYINWNEEGSSTHTRLVSGHTLPVNGLDWWQEVSNGKNYLISGSEDGSVKIWDAVTREQMCQFTVNEQSCTCVSVSPGPLTLQRPNNDVNSTSVVSASSRACAAGYSDGTLRVFCLKRMEMTGRAQPHSTSVTDIRFVMPYSASHVSSKECMILSGSADGLIACTKPDTCLTVRLIRDHIGAPITAFDQMRTATGQEGLIWLTTSADRRISVWSANWSEDRCDLLDWITFAAPNFTPQGRLLKTGDYTNWQHLPKTLAKFAPEGVVYEWNQSTVNDDRLVMYTGYGTSRLLSCYSLTHHEVVFTIPLDYWATSMVVSHKDPFIVVGMGERMVRMIDINEKSFQDFLGHSESVNCLSFSSDCSLLATCAGHEILVWRMQL